MLHYPLRNSLCILIKWASMGRNILAETHCRAAIQQDNASTCSAKLSVQLFQVGNSGRDTR